MSHSLSLTLLHIKSVPTLRCGGGGEACVLNGARLAARRRMGTTMCRSVDDGGRRRVSDA